MALRRAAAPEPPQREHRVLPDGTYITVRGTAGTDNYDDPVKEAVLYDPKTQAWTAMASQLEPRGYHSTALLAAGWTGALRR